MNDLWNKAKDWVLDHKIGLIVGASALAVILVLGAVVVRAAPGDGGSVIANPAPERQHGFEKHAGRTIASRFVCMDAASATEVAKILAENIHLREMGVPTPEADDAFKAIVTRGGCAILPGVVPIKLVKLLSVHWGKEKVFAVWTGKAGANDVYVIGSLPIKKPPT